MNVMKKKGISPLIATVLLIGFTVALAAIIFTWGTDFVRNTTNTVDKQQQNSMLCVNQLDFQIQVDCTNNKIFIDNRGQLDITNLTLRLQKKTGDITVDSQPPIPAFAKTGFDYSPLNQYNKVDATATVKAPDGSVVICQNARREAEVNCP